jgi:hypothetical protein
VPGARLGAAKRTGAQRALNRSSPCAAISSTAISSNARSANMRPTPSFTWRHRPSSASPIATRFPPSKPTSRHLELLEACRRSPGVSKQIVVASSDKAYGDQEKLPYNEDDAAARPPSLRRQQVLRRSDRADLRQNIQPAGRDHALRKFLWRRRPELEPHRSRHHPLVIARRAARRPLRRQFIRDYFYVEDGAAAYMLLAEQLAAARELPDTPSTSPMRAS